MTLAMCCSLNWNAIQGPARGLPPFFTNPRVLESSFRRYLDCIEDILSPATPLQVAFNPSDGDVGGNDGDQVSADVLPSDESSRLPVEKQVGRDVGQGDQGGNESDVEHKAKRQRQSHSVKVSEERPAVVRTPLLSFIPCPSPSNFISALLPVRALGACLGWQVSVAPLL